MKFVIYRKLLITLAEENILTKDKKAKDHCANLLGAVATESCMSLDEVNLTVPYLVDTCRFS